MVLLIATESGAKRSKLKKEFENEGYETQVCGSYNEMVSVVKQNSIPILVCDIGLAQREDFAVLKLAKEKDRNSLPILLTGVGNLETAIEAVRCGAFDYISEPFEINDLKAVVARACARWKTMSERISTNTPAPSAMPVAPKTLVGRSPGIRQVYRAVARATSSESSVLISAETGAGKELVARAIHNNSRRRDGRFIAINCAALTDSLLESELFGHIKGAFTGAIQSKKGFFEEADGGTLFLDEIGDLSQAMQIKLLRVLQEREIRPVGANESKTVNVRIIAATHRNLVEMVARGIFREDLLYRLRVITVKIPPLRERREDIEELANFFLFRYATRENKGHQYISEEAIKLLKAHHWPGNVRELEHAVEYAVSMTASPVLFPEDFPEEIFHSEAKTPDEISQVDAKPKTLDQVECEYILRILKHCDYNVSKAAEILAVDRGTLYRKAEKYNLPLKKKDTEKKPAIPL